MNKVLKITILIIILFSLSYIILSFFKHNFSSKQTIENNLDDSNKLLSKQTIEDNLNDSNKLLSEKIIENNLDDSINSSSKQTLNNNLNDSNKLSSKQTFEDNLNKTNDLTFKKFVEMGQKQKLKTTIDKLTIDKKIIKNIIEKTINNEPELLNKPINYIQNDDKIILVINSNKINKINNLTNQQIKDLKQLRKLYRNFDYNVTYLKQYLELSHTQLNEFQLNELNKLDDRNISPQKGKYYSTKFIDYLSYTYIGNDNIMNQYVNEDLEFILNCPDFIKKNYIIMVDNYIGISFSDLIKLSNNDILSLTLSDIILNYNHREESPKFYDKKTKIEINRLFGSKRQ